MPGGYYAMSAAEAEAEKLRCITGLSDGERVAMAKWVLKGYQFVFFPGNSDSRRWKVLDPTLEGWANEVHTAEKLYVLLAALGEPR